MVPLQRQNGSQQRRKNVSDEANECQEQGPFRLEQVLSDPRKSCFPCGNWKEKQCSTPGPQPLTLASLQTAPGKPLTPRHVKGKFQYWLNRVETFVGNEMQICC